MMSVDAVWHFEGEQPVNRSILPLSMEVIESLLTSTPLDAWCRAHPCLARCRSCAHPPLPTSRAGANSTDTYRTVNPVRNFPPGLARIIPPLSLSCKTNECPSSPWASSKVAAAGGVHSRCTEHFGGKAVDSRCANDVGRSRHSTDGLAIGTSEEHRWSSTTGDRLPPRGDASGLCRIFA